VLTINYTGDQQPSQSGLYGQVSMYRINSPSFKNQQIRARGFADDWFWGSGTLDRADMVFTFVEIDASLVKVFLSKFNAVLESALALANGAQTDVTLGYPTAALNALMNAIAKAQAFADNISEETTQEEINAQVTALNTAITTFSDQRIYTLEGFSTELAHLIYSYGTHPNAGATTADGGIERRYLYAIKTADGQRDSLVYRIGLSENAINGGQKDALATDPAALWALEYAGNGLVRARNQKCGAYLQVANVLSATPVTVRPYYAKHDNGKMAFYIDASQSGNKLFNVGNPDADGKGGPLEFFALHADRTRLRWVIDETAIEVQEPTAIRSAGTTPAVTRYYSLQGTRLTARPQSGIYIEHRTDSNGHVVVVKKK
jgi:hypothetical protein